MKEGLRRFARPLGTVAVIAVVAFAYFLTRASRGEDTEAASSALPPDPGYAARDAQVIETGFDGRERSERTGALRSTRRRSPHQDRLRIAVSRPASARNAGGPRLRAAATSPWGVRKLAANTP